MPFQHPCRILGLESNRSNTTLRKIAPGMYVVENAYSGNYQYFAGGELTTNQLANWVLTSDGTLQKIKEGIGPIVAQAGEWEDEEPTIDPVTKFVVLNLWLSTKDEYPNQSNTLARIRLGPLNLVNMSGLSILCNGAEVTISRSGQSKYFEIASPGSLEAMLAIYKKWLAYREKQIQEDLEASKLTRWGRIRKRLKIVLVRWLGAITIVIAITSLAYYLLPSWVAFGVYTATNVTVGMLTKWLTKL